MNSNITLIQTHKLIELSISLSSMDKQHLQHLIKLAQDPALPDFMGWDTYFELSETDRFIEEIACFTLPYSQQSEPVVLGIYVASKNLPIGYAVLKGFNQELGTVEVGVAVLDKAYKNKGQGRLALQRIVRYAVEDLGMKTVAATILASNKYSCNMVNKVGFAVKELMPNSWTMPNGEIVDMLWVEYKS